MQLSCAERQTLQAWHVRDWDFLLQLLMELLLLLSVQLVLALLLLQGLGLGLVLQLQENQKLGEAVQLEAVGQELVEEPCEEGLDEACC